MKEESFLLSRAVRMPRRISGVAAGSIGAIALMAVACTGGTVTGPGGTAVVGLPTVDRSRVPTAEVIQRTGPPGESGLEITDNCVIGHLPSEPGTGQIIGQGVNVVIDVDTTFTFSRAVSETALVACRPGVGQPEVERLVAGLNGIPGARVRDFAWPGR